MAIGLLVATTTYLMSSSNDSSGVKEDGRKPDPGASDDDEEESNNALLTSAETGESKEEIEEEERIHNKFCEKLAKASTLAHTSRIASMETMQDLRRSCASVRCIELVDVCIAIYSGEKLNTGHDVPGKQWRWHH